MKLIVNPMKMQINKSAYLVYSGVLIWLGICVYYIYLGDLIMVQPHDQLDSEVLYYVLKSQSLQTSFFEEFMNGKAMVEVHAPLITGLYCILPPLYAYIVGMFFVRIVAYVGMLKLLKKFEIEDIISVVVAVLFSCLPFYSVYGLSIMGIPLLMVAVWNLYHKDNILKNCCAVGLYCFTSSLVCSGYFLIILWGFHFVYCLFKKKINKFYAIGFLEFIICYVLLNIELIKSVIGKVQMVSHRVEFEMRAKDFLFSLKEILLVGHYHAPSKHLMIITVVIVYFLLRMGFGLWEKHTLYRFYSPKEKKVCLLLFIVIGICVFYAAFHTEFMISVREKILGATSLKSFQFDRVYWALPVLWYMVLGLTLSCMWDLLKKCQNKLGHILISALFILCAVYASKNSDITSNIFRTNDAITWKDYFAESIFNDIEKCIGRNQDDYKVVSIGLYPSVALYNGFSCLDGYSNNYDVEYKHQFYNVIQDELARDKELEVYFQEWGSRCYVFSSQLDGYLIPKGSDSIDIRLGVDTLLEMGCEYVFSTVLLENAEELNLHLVDYFETSDSYYGIYLYALES